MFVGFFASLPVQANPAILLLPSIGTTHQVIIHGRVLSNAPSSGHSTFSKNVRSLASRNWEGAALEVRFAGRTASTVSGDDGDFEVAVNSGEVEFETGLGVVEATVKGAKSVAVVDVIAATAPFFVISDFDDTVAVTNVLRSTALLESAFLKDGVTQPPVEGMAKWYQCLKQGPTERPVFALVSGSPVQFGDRVKTFLRKNGFPQFGVYLRDLGPSTLSEYKQPVIRKLLAALPQKVVLIGDSGEKDPEVYAQIQKEFPDRVLATYIRNVGRDEDPKRFRNMMLFKEPAEAAADSAGRSLASAECVKAWLSP